MLVVGELLGILAARQNGMAVDEAARTRLASAIAGAPLATWPLTSADDLIAGRVFGRSRFQVDDNGLRIESQGEAVEFGVRLSRPLDAERYPVIRLAVVGDSRFRYQWSAADSPLPCRSPPQPAHEGHFDSRLDQLTWTCADGSTAISMPAIRYLRLVVDGPAGASTRLRDLQIGPAAPLRLPDRSTIPVISAKTDLAATISTLSALPGSMLPVAIVPDASSSVTGLQLGLQVQKAVPAVVVASSIDVLDAPAPPAPSRGVVTATLLLVLLAIWLWPPTNAQRRAAAQLLAALLMPLWLSIGGRLGTQMHALDGLLLISGGAYLLLRIRETTAWHWIGGRKAWLLPALSVMLAIGVALSLPTSATDRLGPSATDIARYLGWAGIQQLILMTVVADRLSVLNWPMRWVVLGTAAAFALLHSPNEPLMLLTLIGGLLWTWNWQRHRALLPNIVAHALCGLIAMSWISRDWLPSAEVGSRFFSG